MSFIDTVVLTASWLDKPPHRQRPARTILVGAATLHVRERVDGWRFMLEAHGMTAADDPVESLLWLAEDLAVRPSRFLLWRARHIVPALIAAAETAPDELAGAKLLRELERAHAREVQDVAQAFGDDEAAPFDAIARAHGLPVVPIGSGKLAEAYRTGNHAAIRQSLAARVKATWRLWLSSRQSHESLIAATETWLASPDAEIRP